MFDAMKLPAATVRQLMNARPPCKKFANSAQPSRDGTKLACTRPIGGNALVSLHLDNCTDLTPAIKSVDSAADPGTASADHGNRCSSPSRRM